MNSKNSGAKRKNGPKAPSQAERLLRDPAWRLSCLYGIKTEDHGERIPGLPRDEQKTVINPLPETPDIPSASSKPGVSACPPPSCRKNTSRHPRMRQPKLKKTKPRSRQRRLSSQTFFPSHLKLTSRNLPGTMHFPSQTFPAPLQIAEKSRKNGVTALPKAILSTPELLAHIPFPFNPLHPLRHRSTLRNSGEK